MYRHNDQTHSEDFTIPCPIFRWDYECKKCNATFEVHYPPEIAFEYRMGYIKMVFVSNKDAYEYHSHQPVDGFVSEVVANVCPFCGTPLCLETFPPHFCNTDPQRVDCIQD